MLIHTAVIKHVPPQPIVKHKTAKYESAYVTDYDVFPVHSQETGYTCAAACILALKYYYGFQHNESEKQIAEQLNTTPEKGAYPEAVISYLKSKGWTVQSYIDQGSPREWTDFQIFLDWYLLHDIPIMVEHGYPDSHWYLIIGYDDSNDTLIIADPWTDIHGGKLVISARDFFNTWYDKKLGTVKAWITAKPSKK